MWNRKRKVYKYYISQMVFVGREKNLDFRAGPDMLDIYERRDSECSKEVYEKYPHEKVSCTKACYYRKEDTYTYCKYEGEEIVSPEESYNMVKNLLSLPIEKVKVSSKNDIKWALKALEILVEEKNREIWRVENQTDKYTDQYIKKHSSILIDEMKKMNMDRIKLLEIYDNFISRKAVRMEAKKQQEETIKNALKDKDTICVCGATISYHYNKCFCGNCGGNVEKIWSKFARKLAKSVA